VESLSKLIAAGIGIANAHLSFQEFFERLGDDPARWGKPVAALLGALEAQLGYQIGAIGGKDSMSGSFGDLRVPPTFISFAVAVGKADSVISPEFKRSGSRVALLAPDRDERGLPVVESQKRLFDEAHELISKGRAVSAWAVAAGGIAEGIFKMCLGNRVGFAFDPAFPIEEAFSCNYGAFLLEIVDDAPFSGRCVGATCEPFIIAAGDERVPLDDISTIYEAKLEGVFSAQVPAQAEYARADAPLSLYAAGKAARSAVSFVKPRALIPVFPGTSCEYDVAFALERAGAVPVECVINTLTPQELARSVKEFAALADNSQIIVISGGFTGGDEPDSAARLIAAFLRNPAASDAVTRLLKARGGLMAGINNGFQALLKLGLLPWGVMRDQTKASPALAGNLSGRHCSRLARVKIMSDLSPWLAEAHVGEVQLIPISHGEGRFACGADTLAQLFASGQVATQYVGLDSLPSMDISVNPGGSMAAIEGITSPDGRVFGRMGHAERWGEGLYKNVPGADGRSMFTGAVRYFK
jgi:phosphoribosylformylglycinamidine synthase